MQRKKPAGEKHSEVVFTLLKRDERRQVEQAAEREGLSLSAVIRRAVLRDLEQESVGGTAK